MKSLINYIFFCALLIAGSTGCKRYLDVKPKGVDIASTVEHYNGLFNNVSFSSFGNYQISPSGVMPGDQANLPVIMGDEVYSLAPYNSGWVTRYSNAYHWAADVYKPDENAADWTAYYLQNYTYNTIANDVMDATGGSDSLKKQLRAEARANRAFLHFMLVNLFGKPYSGATAANDPGVPLITIADATATAGKRASVQEVYDFVTSELRDAIPSLPENTVNRLRLAKPAATYMLGQAYFLQAKYDSALTQLEASRNLYQNSTATTLLYDYNTMIPQWQMNPAFPPNLPVGPNNFEAICQRQIQISFTGSLFLDPSFENMYNPADLRLKFFSKTALYGGGIYPAYTRTGPYQVNAGPSVANLYLMIAECKARLNDVAGAKAELEYFRQHRMPANVASVPVIDKNDLIKFIVDERLREYALTGMRWFDIRRLWNDPLFNDKKYIHKDDKGTYELTADRLTLRVPPKILSYNPGMENNP